MSGDWTEQLERRAEGLVPGYIGNNDQTAPASAITGELEQIVSGLAADRPAATAYRGWYFATDTAALTRSDGAAWSAQPGSGSYVPQSPTLALTYNADGSVATMTENGVVSTFTYNGNGTVNTVTRSGVTRTYSYNADGTISGVA